MSIYIKGMEMPKSCAWCPLNSGCYCAATKEGQYIGACQKEKTKPDFCPLVEVPPHGRLIDANALKTKRHGNNSQRVMWSNIEMLLDAAPTIIQADPEEKEDAE